MLANGSRVSRGWAASLALVLICCVAFLLRIYGIDWDRGLFFHPDERQILMVVAKLSIPGRWQEFFSVDSPLNPHFFAYGSLPLYLLRLVVTAATRLDPAWASINRFYLLGRLVAAVVDTASIAALYLLGRKVFGRLTALLAAFLMAFTVLHIQLAHFYTVDTLAVLFVLLAVAKAVDVANAARLRDGVLLGVCIGLGLATKVSLLPLLVVAALAWLATAWEKPVGWRQLLPAARAAVAQVGRSILLTWLVALASFLLLQPYALIDLRNFVFGIGQELAMAQGLHDFPYTRQYVGTLPYLYQLRQLLWFTMGLPLGLFGLVGMTGLALRTWRRPSRQMMVFLSWPVIYGLSQGTSYAKFVRYSLPLLPFLCLAGAATWSAAWRRAAHLSLTRARRKWLRGGLALALLTVAASAVLYSLAFMNVYRQVHPWIQASQWLCPRLRTDTSVMIEWWDDPLPSGWTQLDLGCPSWVHYYTVDSHAQDDEDKLARLLDGLVTSDYVVLSSQRLYRPVTLWANSFPTTSRYFDALFAEELGFRLAAAPAVFPQLAGLTLVDDPREGLPLSVPPLLAASRPTSRVIILGKADESFTVYDHPQPLIFEKVEQLSAEQMRQRILSR